MNLYTAEDWLCNLFGQHIENLKIIVEIPTVLDSDNVLTISFSTLENFPRLDLPSLKNQYGKDGSMQIKEKVLIFGTEGFCNYVYEIKQGDIAETILALLSRQFKPTETPVEQVK